MAEYVYRPVIGAVLGAFRVLDLRIDVHGEEFVPAEGGAVVAINHISYFDFAIAGVPYWKAKRRLVRFMAKEAVFRHPVSGPLMRGMKHIPVDRSAGASSYRAAVEALRSGELVGVFPESTISPDFDLAPFKRGAARMAAEADVPVIPMIIWGSQRTFTKGHSFNFRRSRHVPVTIILGAPMPAKLFSDAEAGTAALTEVMRELLAEARSTYPEPDRLP